MGADDRVGTHSPGRRPGEMHRAPLAAAYSIGPTQQFRHQRTGWRTPQQSVYVTSIGAEGEIVRTHSGRESGCNRLLPGGEVRGSLDQSLEEQLVGVLLEDTRLEHQPVDAKPGIHIPDRLHRSYILSTHWPPLVLRLERE